MTNESQNAVTWLEAIQSKPQLKNKLISVLGPFGAVVFLCVVFLLMPALLLVGLALIGVHVEWLNPLVWLGAVIVVMVLE